MNSSHLTLFRFSKKSNAHSLVRCFPRLVDNFLRSYCTVMANIFRGWEVRPLTSPNALTCTTALFFFFFGISDRHLRIYNIIITNFWEIISTWTTKQKNIAVRPYTLHGRNRLKCKHVKCSVSFDLFFFFFLLIESTELY